MPGFRVFQGLQQAHSALFRAADRRLRTTLDLTASQQAILFLLRARGPLPITDIAKALHMGNSSITGLVNRMTAKNWLRREVTDADGRVQLIALQPAGATLCEEALPLVTHLNEQLLAPFDETQQQTIKSFLDHIREHAGSIIADSETPKTEKRQTS